MLFQFLNVPMFRNVTLKCLNEVAGVSGANYDDMFIALFTQTMGQLELVSNPIMYWWLLIFISFFT